LPVSLSIFREFVLALEGEAVKITDTHFTEYESLCEELRFSECAAKFAEFRCSIGFSGTRNADAYGRIAALQGKTEQRGAQDKFMQFVTDVGSIAEEVSALQFDAMRTQVLSREISDHKP
jgi:hypothetical protein